jgi:hypothetical protein
MGGFETLYRLTSTRGSSRGERRRLLSLDDSGGVVGERISEDDS